MLSKADRSKAAKILLAAEEARKPALQLSKTFPDITIEDAYAIQSEVTRLKVAAGHRVRGHKVGLTSKAMQQSSQIDEPDYGHLMDYMFIADGAKIPFERFIVPRVEIELAFVLGKALKGPGVELVDVLRATEYVVPAIEIIDARVQNPRKIFDTVSDNGAAAGIVMGGRPVGPMEVDLRWVSGLLSRNSESRKPVSPRACSVIRRWASPGSPTKWAVSAPRSSPGMWCSPVRSRARYGRRKAIRCVPTSARWARFPFSLFDRAAARRAALVLQNTPGMKRRTRLAYAA